MSSWSYRSRSRSPDRRTSGPQPGGRYAEFGPMGTDRRGDWERERDPSDRGPWGGGREREGYEQDRDWDYRRSAGPPGAPPSMRGRSRSPNYGDDRRKRRRSLSPYDRERPRYGEDYDYYRPQSPRRGGYRPYSPPPHPARINGAPDPWTAESPVTFRVFNDWFRMNYPGQVKSEEAATEENASGGIETKNPMKARYEDYKKKISLMQLQTLFDFHKTSPWFKERYDPAPEYVELRTRVRREGWKGRIDDFLNQLEAGQHDPTLDLPDVITTNNTSTTHAAAPSNGDLPAENPDVEMGGFASEDARQDEDVDAVMFDSADAPGEVTNGAGNGKATAGVPQKAAANTNQEETASVTPEGNQVMIRTIPPDIGRPQLEQVCKDLPGFQYLAIGDPMQKRNYYRCGWIKFSEDADMTETVQKLAASKVDGFKLHVMHSVQPFTAKVRSTPPIASEIRRAEKDLQNVKTLAAALENQAYELSQSQLDATPTIGDVESKEFISRGSQAVEKHIEKLYSELRSQHFGANEEVLAAKRTLIALDLYLAYLRTAFNCCYYCAAITDHSEELLRKCIKHIRTPCKAGADWKDDRWTSWLDAKAMLLTNRDSLDPSEFGGKNPDLELSKAAEPHIKKEEESKYRCKTCNKLFKGVAFVEKHVANKHGELVNASLDGLPFFNNFALDPHRIQPFTHYPPSSSGGQQPPPQAYGLRTMGPGTGPDMGRMPPPHHNGTHMYGMIPPHMAYGAPPNDPYGYYPPPPPYARRRSPPPGHRRLSDRLGDRPVDMDAAPLNIGRIEGLPPKPMTALPPEVSRRGGKGRDIATGTTAIPARAPANVKEDPRAASGKKVSYHDMDEVAEGDVELMY